MDIKEHSELIDCKREYPVCGSSEWCQLCVVVAHQFLGINDLSGQ